MAGEYAGIRKAIDIIRREVPTCWWDDKVDEVYKRTQATGWKVCIVVNERNVVLDRLRGEAWQEADPQSPVEVVMENGPTTFRPDNFLEALVNRMKERKVGSVIITNSDGGLIGVLFRKDGEELLHRDHSMNENKN
jgi:CBS domain-containing protein